MPSPCERAVYLALPCYGGVEPGALPGLLLATSAARWTLMPYGGSLLAYTFNNLWVGALNSREAQGWTHFAMHHNDIDAEPGWLDTLMDELDRTGADVVSVAVAIKDTRGLCSCGVMEQSGNIRRLTLRELYQLPETFGIEDIAWAPEGSHLAVNTGLWVCRFTAPWVEKVCFNIADAIVKGDDGTYRAHVLPEDWNFSRWLHQQGLRVRCTRKVTAGHTGKSRFANDRPWGDWSEDLGDGQRQYWASAVLPDVDGWLTDSEGQALARLAAGKSVLEIGSYKGRSTIWMARTARHVTAVDTFDGAGTWARGQDTFATCAGNLDRHGVADRVTLHRGVSWEVLPGLPRAFDLVFVDGSHEYEAVRADAARARDVLLPGGLLCFHDYNSLADPGVTRAVNGLLASGGELLEVVGSLAVVRPPDCGLRNAECGLKDSLGGPVPVLSGNPQSAI